MNSLKTDDILGARPRVRHMPKNLIRERSIPTAFLTNMQPVNPEWQNINRPKNLEAVQYENHEPYNSPYYSGNIRSKQPQYLNYDLLNNKANKADQYSKSRHHSPNKESNQPNRYRYQPYNQSREQMSRNRPESNYKSGQPTTQVQEAKRPEQLQNIRRSESQSRRSSQSKDYKAEEGKKIFRGLGFNIISNHKFEYTFEHQPTTQPRF